METLTTRHPSTLFECLLLAPPVYLASNVTALQLQAVELLVLVLCDSSSAGMPRAERLGDPY